ncbi:MAG: hypothetical protein ACREN5_15145, partial [Gemmatimonadales bacterium]
PQNSPTELENSAAIDFYLKSAPAGKGRLEIADLAGQQRFTADVDAHQGINRYLWKLRFDPPAVDTARVAAPGEGAEGFGPPVRRGVEAAAGTYRVRLSVGGKEYVGTVTVRDDPGL